VSELISEMVRKKPKLNVRIPYIYTKALERNTGKPEILSHAEAFREVMESLPIVIRRDELIVGTFDCHVPVVIPRMEGSGLRIKWEIERLDKRETNPIQVEEEDLKLYYEILPFWEKYNVMKYSTEMCGEEPFQLMFTGGLYVLTEIGGVAHAIMDYPRMLEKGLKYYIDRCDDLIQRYKEDLNKNPSASEKIVFYRAVKVVCESIIDLAHRYSEKALELAKSEEDPERKAELERIHKICSKVPEFPPESFHEALQFIWFLHMALHIENFEHGISFGRMDQYLVKYYDGDYEEAVRLLRNLFLKTNEILALYDSIATIYFGGMATTQGVVVGGVDSEGEDATNELTFAIIDAIALNKLPSPNLTIRVHSKTPKELYQKVVEYLVDGVNALGFNNDEVVIEALKWDGCSLDEARDYSIVGCVGLSTSGNGFNNTASIFFNLAKVLEVVLGTDETSASQFVKLEMKDYSNVDELIEDYRKALVVFLEYAIAGANALQIAHRDLKPTPLMSLCIDGCFESGSDVNAGSAKYNFSGIHFAGFSDVIDSISAIQRAIFEEKVASFDDLVNALRSNFSGYEWLRDYLRYKCPKYGNDDDDADSIATKLSRAIVDALNGFKNARGGKWRAGLHAMTTHVGFGMFTGALPSGRLKGKPLSRDAAPTMGGEEGLTATIRSLSKIDWSRFSNGIACTFTIHPDIARLENGNLFEGIVRSAVKLGVMHFQFNALSPKLLKEAQENPEKYQDLLVRVSGYSARFVDLPREVQNEIIGRMCYRS